MFRVGLIGTLSACTGLAVAGECDDFHDALQLAPALSPNVVFLCSTGHSGEELVTQVRTLRTQLPQAQVVVVADSLDMDTLLRARVAGVAMFLTRAASPRDVMLAAMVSWHDLSGAAPRSGPSARPAIDSCEMGSDLTARERDLLRLMALGLSNKDISGRLGIAIPTVKYHIGNVLSKLGTDNRTGAVLAALRNNLVCLE